MQSVKMKATGSMINGDKTTTTDVLIIGAGVSGLMAAHVLRKQGLQVILLEKEARVGGRMATVQIGPGRADSGAQFFTVRNPHFQEWVERWQFEGRVFAWSRGWSDGSLHKSPPDGHPRYAARDGMAALAAHMAADLDVRLNVELQSVRVAGKGWEAESNDGATYTAQALLMTPPVPIALSLLDAGDVSITIDDRAALNGLNYVPGLVGLFWVQGPLYIPPPGAIQRANMPVGWVADNQAKGISEVRIVTAHSAAKHAQALWTAEDEIILDRFKQGFHRFLGPRAEIREAHLVRWQYAAPEVTLADPYLILGDDPLLVLAGDAFGGPRVEGAAVSGMAAAQAVGKHIGAASAT
jgi:renalase